MAALLEGGGDPSIGLVYKKRSLSLMQMIMLNAVVCGLEFCASAGFTYIPPLLLKTGLSESRMTFVMGLGPLLGIFLVPVLGKASDRCKSAYGRRRPFIFWLSIGCIISLLVIPYAQIITERVLGAESFGRTIGVLVLCGGVVLLDFTTQACLNPCEALLSDASKGTEQQDSIFTVYSVMISVGGCLGYFITAIDWKSSSFGLYFTSQEQSAFSLLIVLFTVSLLATLHVAEERPVRSGLLQPVAGEDPSKIQQESGYETSSNSSISEAGPSSVVISPTHHQHSLQRTNSLQERLRSSVKPVCSLINTDCHLPFRSRLLMAMAYRLRTFWRGIVNCLPTGVKQFCNMPVVLKRLVMADFCSWTAIMAFNFFYTDFMGQAVYGGSPNAEESSPLRDLYDQGVRMGSWGLLFHCIVSAVFAPFVERLSDKFGPRKTFISGMMSFSVAMMLMVFVTNARMVSLMAALTGFGYACVTIIPFTLVTEYHQDQEVYFYDTRIASSPGSVDGESPHIPVRGMAGDMAMLDSAYFFSEVALSLVMGYIVHYSGTAKAYMVTAAVLGVAACFLILRVLTDKQEVISRIREQRQLKNLQLTTES